MTVNNFAFIQPELPVLARLLGEAERLLDDDSSCFLLKVRLSLELWCHEFARMHQIELSSDTTLAEKLDFLSAEKIFPAELLQQLLELRQLANQAVHIMQDQRGRHATLAPLKHPQQVAILQCLFDLVSYSKRCLQPEAPLPVWQVYPKRNIRLTLDQAVLGGTADLPAGVAVSIASAPGCLKACLQMAQHYLPAAQPAKKSAGTNQQKDGLVDTQYWLQRALRLGLQRADLTAIQQLADWVFNKQHPYFDVTLLEHWLAQYQQCQPAAPLLHLQGQLLERQQQLTAALQCYHDAASAGHLPAIKRLLDYWGTRDFTRLQQYLQLGVQHNDAQALLTSMALLVNDAGNAIHRQESPLCLPELQSLVLRARAFAVSGFGYIEGICHLIGMLDYPQDRRLAAELVLANLHKVPAYCQPAVNAFYIMLLTRQPTQALRLAPKALAQQAPAAAVGADGGKLEFDIAMTLLQLHQKNTPQPFHKTPQQLLQSAAQKGCAAARQFLQKAGRGLKLPRPLATHKTVVVPAWVSQLTCRGSRNRLVAHG